MYNCSHTNYQIIVMPHAHRDTAITGMFHWQQATVYNYEIKSATV